MELDSRRFQFKLMLSIVFLRNSINIPLFYLSNILVVTIYLVCLPGRICCIFLEPWPFNLKIYVVFLFSIFCFYDMGKGIGFDLHWPTRLEFDSIHSPYCTIVIQSKCVIISFGQNNRQSWSLEKFFCSNSKWRFPWIFERQIGIRILNSILFQISSTSFIVIPTIKCSCGKQSTKATWKDLESKIPWCRRH